MRRLARRACNIAQLWEIEHELLQSEIHKPELISHKSPVPTANMTTYSIGVDLGQRRDHSAIAAVEHVRHAARVAPYSPPSTPQPHPTNGPSAISSASR